MGSQLNFYGFYFKHFNHFKGKVFNCPLKFYKCSGNIVKLDRLVSGYYEGQKLDDDTPVEKPEHLDKCSHGGVLDKTQITPASGKTNF